MYDMIRTLSNIIKQDKEKFVIPKSVQQAIPIQTIWKDGTFKVGRNKFSRTFKFQDINYEVASRDDKKTMFLGYSEILNSFDSGATTKITINNRKLNREDFEKAILILLQDDELDVYPGHFARLGSKCTEMDATDGVETNITNWQRRQNANNNFSAVVPYDMEQQRKESKEFLDDLTTRDQRMMFAVLTLVHTAESKEQLDSDTDTLLSIGRKHLCQFAVLKYQQMDGLNTVLPIGHRKIHALRTLTTESLAVLMPFRVQEIMDEGGIYCGENAISHNWIMCNRANLLNPNSFLLGIPGSGKSFNAKMLIVFLALATQDDILVCDPEREYAALVEAMGGEVIQIAAGRRQGTRASTFFGTFYGWKFGCFCT